MHLNDLRFSLCLPIPDMVKVWHGADSFQHKIDSGSNSKYSENTQNAWI